MAIDAIKEKETLQELASKYKVSAVTISKWELYRGIKVYIDYYNNKRAHQGIGRIRPCEAYKLEAA